MKKSETTSRNADAVNHFGLHPAEACEKSQPFKGAAYASQDEHGNVKPNMFSEWTQDLTQDIFVYISTIMSHFFENQQPFQVPVMWPDSKGFFHRFFRDFREVFSTCQCSQRPLKSVRRLSPVVIVSRSTELLITTLLHLKRDCLLP